MLSERGKSRSPLLGAPYKSSRDKSSLSRVRFLSSLCTVDSTRATPFPTTPALIHYPQGQLLSLKAPANRSLLLKSYLRGGVRKKEKEKEMLFLRI